MWQKAKNIYHLFVAIFANVLYGFPAQKLTVIGVTGTDGKTTTTSLIYHILKENGYPASLISTVGAVIHGKTSDIGFHVTNPSSLPLQRFLSHVVKQKDRYLVLEVTSHGLDQNRVWGIPFAIGVLTNITHEHLDYHKTYDNYAKTKIRLLNSAKVAVVNSDDGSYKEVSKYLRDKKKLITYALDKKADITAKDIKIPDHFLGKHNAYNALAAIGVARKIGIPEAGIQKALLTFVFPKGRGEIVYKKDFTLMIDFAHTPNAFEQLLSSLRPTVAGRLIHVFGSAGARDNTKRPLMGEVASAYDDIVILTSEDPRHEKPEKIINEIEMGMNTKNHVQIFEIVDRKAAIEKAVSLAQKGDYIVLTGKAHEKSNNMGHGEDPWDEFNVAAEAIKKYAKTN
ncbi:MAG TPA: UDP-N-acetylmuramoyl-L-alanyl-D-glutamate--2,6-diaminopimelate ligase [Candidatus Saccharimonadales bacterium]|nr:UDP-N-acetylmuramoyl-L-alanyl-D-glutamate--2,6-diaminopimelate ligase [Candidatus Saccharimonadales bacterium]